MTDGAEKPFEIVVEESNLEFLRANRIQVLGPIGQNNRIAFATPADEQSNVVVRFNGYAGTEIVLGYRHKFNGEIHVYGDETRFSIGQSTFVFQGRVFLYERSAEVRVGEMCSSNMVHVVSWGASGRVIIGDHCMFSFNIWLRASDEHGIIDFSGADPCQTNLPQDVVIGSGVWVGQDALILKGITIGRGSLIGARSLVSGHIPEFVLATGSPARILRTNVTWSRHAKPTLGQMRQEVLDKHALLTLQAVQL
jgi:acetyltransferase-like isoleucine patch superfamily enzyme